MKIFWPKYYVLLFICLGIMGCDQEELMRSDLDTYVKLLGETMENEGRDFIQLSDESFMILMYSRTSSGNDNFIQHIDKNGNLVSYVNFQSQPFPALSKIFYSPEGRIFLFGTANDFNFDKFFLAEIDNQANTLSKKNISNPILEEKKPDKIYLLSAKLFADMGMIGIMYGLNDPSKSISIRSAVTICARRLPSSTAPSTTTTAPCSMLFRRG